MKRLILKYFNYFIAMATLVSCAKSEGFEPEERFINYYGTNRDEQLVDVEEIKNATNAVVEGYLLLGTTNSQGNGDIMLSRVDTAGNLVWQRIYDDLPDSINNTTNEIDMAGGMCITDNGTGNVVIVGTRITTDIGTEMLIYEVGLDGTTIVSRALKYKYTDNRLAGNDVKRNTAGTDVVSIGDQIFVMGNVHTSPTIPTSHNPDDEQSVILIKFEKEGVLDQQNFVTNVIGSRSGDAAVCLKVDDNNDLYSLYAFNIDSEKKYSLFTINTIKANEKTGFNISKLSNELLVDASGNYFDATSDLIPSDMIVSEGGISVTGTVVMTNSSSRIFLKTTAGKIFFAENDGRDAIRYAPTDLSTYSTFASRLVRVSEAGRIYIVGTIEQYTDPLGLLRQDEVIIVRANALGDEFDNSYNETFGGNLNDEGRGIIERKDQGLLVGATVGFGSSSNMMTLVRMNKEGKLFK